LSISGTYAEEILFRAEINKKIACSSLTEQQLEDIFSQLQTLLSAINEGTMKPRVVNDDDGTWVDVTSVPLRKHEGLDHEEYESFNSALDDYYAKQTDVEKLDEATGDVENEVARQTRILKRQEKALESLKAPITENKALGDLIYLHFGDLQELLRKIMKQKNSGKPWNQITETLEAAKQAKQLPELYFKSLEPANQILHLSIDSNVFSLNLRKSLQDNANTYYSRSKKAEKKLRGAEKQLQETRTKIEKAKKKVTKTKDTQQPLAKQRKKEWFEKFRWFYSSDGFLVIGGRDATTNEIIIKKHMDPTDIVFHAEIVGAPFVVIKTEGKTALQQTINEAAQLAASYSKAWREMLSSVNVYWIKPSQVSKTPPSGQFLKKGSFMIRGKKNFVRNVPLRVAVGIKVEEKTVLAIGGPVEAISSQTKVYLEIVPGEQKSSQLAKKLRHSLSKKVPEDLVRTVTGIPLEDFQRVIPLGRGKIAQRRR
jgi:predicted ribosome quality control (RQC) complex YloA/Tae2 family protein